MFARAYSLIFFLLFALPLLAVATPSGIIEARQGQCNTGPIQCCNQTLAATDPLVGLLAGLLGVVLGPITALVGVNCSPISVIGVGGNSCSANPVCCTNNGIGGLLSIGCLPISLGL
ncbi:hypothetical protein QCA50_010189 [Cerrena zonata]|uniref:Hydrophobin n=1 Tax=Cerrena zonata TaxID=2478898 RepID=A0AAW0G8M8_9APHY